MEKKDEIANVPFVFPESLLMQTPPDVYVTSPKDGDNVNTVGEADSNYSKNQNVQMKCVDFFTSTPYNLSPNQRQNPNETVESVLTEASIDVTEYPVISPGESILKSLHILSRIHRLEKEEERLSQLRRKTTKKRDEKTESPPFVFTSDMFDTSNPKAFYHVTHFLFEILDSTETEIVFRTCWPVFEKKQEQEYKRNAFNWTARIVEENLDFFQDVSLQFSLFVSPGGDRFLRFLDSFVQFVMYTVAQRMDDQEEDDDEVALLEKPNYNTTPEEQLFQIQMYQEERSELLKKSSTELDETMKIIEQHSESENRTAKEIEEHENFLVEEKEKLREIVNENPELFPEQAEELIDERFLAIKKEARNTKPRWSPTQCSVSDDSLSVVLTKEWTDKLQTVESSFKKVEEFCSKHVKLCKMVEALENNANIELDGHKLSGLNKTNPDLGLYFQKMLGKVECFRNETENLGKPSKEVLEAYTIQNERESFLAYRKTQSRISESLRSSAMFEDNSIDDEQLAKEIELKTKALQMKLDGAQWEILSKCDQHAEPEALFTWTPAKVVEFGNNEGESTKSTIPVPTNGTPKRKINL